MRGCVHEASLGKVDKRLGVVDLKIVLVVLSSSNAGETKVILDY